MPWTEAAAPDALGAALHQAEVAQVEADALAQVAAIGAVHRGVGGGQVGAQATGRLLPGGLVGSRGGVAEELGQGDDSGLLARGPGPATWRVKLPTAAEVPTTASSWAGVQGGQDPFAALEGLLLVVLEGEQGQVGDALGGLEVDEEEVLVLAQPVVVADRQVLAGFLAREGVLGVEDGEASFSWAVSKRTTAASASCSRRLMTWYAVSMPILSVSTSSKQALIRWSLRRFCISTW